MKWRKPEDFKIATPGCLSEGCHETETIV